MNSLAPLGTAFFIFICNVIIIYLFKINDDELRNNIDSNSLYKMYLGSFVAGIVIGCLPEPINNFMIIPTVVMFVAAETDLLIQQIYSITCLVSFIVGVCFIVSYNYGIKSFLLHGLICTAMLLLFRLIKALNTGDVELIFSLTPYFYIVSAELVRPTFIESFVLFLIATCAFSLCMNLKKYVKDKVSSFPFAVPTCFCYCGYFFIINICNYMK